VLTAQNCDSDILEGLAIANRPPKLKTHCFLVGEIGKVLMAQALLTEVVTLLKIHP
jgi:hypothetical protein